MQNHQTRYHLSRISQNAAALAQALEDDEAGVPSGADERPALMTELRSKLREDFVTLSSEPTGLGDV